MNDNATFLSEKSNQKKNHDGTKTYVTLVDEDFNLMPCSSLPSLPSWEGPGQQTQHRRRLRWRRPHLDCLLRTNITFQFRIVY